MNGSIARGTAMTLSLLVFGSCASEPEPAGFDAALRASKRDYYSSGGSRYARAVSRAVRVEFPKIARTCYFETRNNVAVTLLYRLDAGGQPTESLVHPANEFSHCLNEGFGSFTFPPPPKPGYWLYFHVPAGSRVLRFWGRG